MTALWTFYFYLLPPPRHGGAPPYKGGENNATMTQCTTRNSSLVIPNSQFLLFNMWYNNHMNKNAIARANIFTDLMEELKRVTWPTRAETIRLTTVVIVISLIIGVYIGIIDLGLAKVLELLTKTR